jgi:uncharacterized membrane protein
MCHPIISAAIRSVATIIDWLVLVAALGSGLIAGTFFAFSAFVMRALGRLPAAQGITAMQKINIVVINPLFLSVFLGTAGLSVVMLVWSLTKLGTAAGVYLLIASLAYLIGTFGVTMRLNVPLNDRLAGVGADTTEGEKVWANYLVEWTKWNHVRTVAALIALLFFILSPS